MLALSDAVAFRYRNGWAGVNEEDEGEGSGNEAAFA